MKNLSGQPVPGQKLNPGLPEYEAAMPTPKNYYDYRCFASYFSNLIQFKFI
jgi:hypothetical protein